jgi:hypothetical protein
VSTLIKKLVDVFSSSSPAAINTIVAGALLASNNLSDLASVSAALAHLGIGTAGLLDVGVAANKVVQFTAAGKYPAADGSQITGIAQSGRLIAGTPCVMNPTTANGVMTTAHGLGQIPQPFHAYLECLITEGGYSVGDRMYPPALANQWGFVADATNVIIHVTGQPQYWVKSTTSVFNITYANWKAVVVPYKLT